MGERHFGRFVDHAADGLFLTVRGGRFVDVNAEGCRMHGYTRDELLGLTVLDLQQSLDAETFDGLWESTLPGEPVTVESESRRKDGSLFPVEVRLSRLESDGEELMLALVRDVTARKMAEAELMRLRVQRERSQRVEAVGQLAGGIAHDFNNLLSVIRNYTQFAIEEADQLPGLRADLEEVEKAAARATELTRALLVFSGHDVLEADIVDVNVLVQDNEAILRRTIGEGIALRADLADELWPTRAGAGQLEQILVHLAVNARSAMPGGGTLALTTENLAFEEGDHVGPGGRPGRFVRLTVADSGSGMSEDVAAHAFDLFFTTKPTGQGSGLGLATVYGIARQLGGYAQLDSEPGVGTTVRIYLPAVDPVDGPGRAPEPSVDAGRGERILVVADLAPLRRVTCRILSEHGYEVIEADSLEAALAVWQERGSEIDLLLTDVISPLSSGGELMDRLRAARPELAILLMSSSGVAARNGSRQLAQVVEKPFTTAGLLRSVHQALGEPA